MPDSSGGSARSHLPFAIVFGLGVVMRAMAWMAHRPALMVADSSIYLANAGPVDPTAPVPVGYSLFLKPILWFDSITATVVANHLMGLAIGALVYGLVRQVGGSSGWAALAALPVLLDTYQLQMERMIMSETLFTLLVVLGLSLLAGRSPNVGATFMAGVILGTATTVRTVGVVVVLVAVAAQFLGRVEPGTRLLRGVALLVGVAIPLGALAAWTDSRTGEAAVTPPSAVADLLYVRVAPFVDCGDQSVPADLRALCPTAQQQATWTANDYLERPDSPLRTFRPAQGERADAVRSFAWRAIRDRPVAWVAAVTRDTARAFSFTKRQFPRDEPIETWRFQADQFPSADRVAAAAATFGGRSPTVVSPWAQWLRSWQLSLGTLPPVVLGVCALLGLAGGVVAGRKGHAELATAIVLSTTAGIGLVVAAAMTHFSWRYQVPTFALLPMAGVLGVRALTARRAGGGPTA